MTLRELINSNSYKSVFNFLYKTYYKDRPKEEVTEIDLSYLGVWKELIKKDLNLKKDYKILIREVEDEFVEAVYIDVCLMDDSGETFAIDFVLWGDLIDATVAYETELPESEMLAHILWEITFYGFSESTINKFKDELDDQVERIENGDEGVICFDNIDDFNRSLEDL